MVVPFRSWVVVIPAGSAAVKSVPMLPLQVGGAASLASDATSCLASPGASAGASSVASTPPSGDASAPERPPSPVVSLTSSRPRRPAQPVTAAAIAKASAPRAFKTPPRR
jgi:hypothetical protein